MIAMGSTPQISYIGQWMSVSIPATCLGHACHSQLPHPRHGQCGNFTFQPWEASSSLRIIPACCQARVQARQRLRCQPWLSAEGFGALGQESCQEGTFSLELSVFSFHLMLLLPLKTSAFSPFPWKLPGPRYSVLDGWQINCSNHSE